MKLCPQLPLPARLPLRGQTCLRPMTLDDALDAPIEQLGHIYQKKREYHDEDNHTISTNGYKMNTMASGLMSIIPSNQVAVAGFSLGTKSIYTTDNALVEKRLFLSVEDPPTIG